jgi:hypothetical protein
MDDPAFGRVPRAAAMSPTHFVGTRAYRGYVEESDSASEASWKEASCKDNEGIHLKTNQYQPPKAYSSLRKNCVPGIGYTPTSFRKRLTAPTSL